MPLRESPSRLHAARPRVEFAGVEDADGGARMTKPVGCLTDDEARGASRVELRRVIATPDLESWDMVLYPRIGDEPLAVDVFTVDDPAELDEASAIEHADHYAEFVLGCLGLKRTEPWAETQEGVLWAHVA
jgi:hypothetical protein